MTTATAAPKAAHHRRRNLVVLAAVLVAAAGALLYTWHRTTDTISYVRAEDTTLETLGKATYAAIAVFPDPAVTPQNLSPCGNSGHVYSMTTKTTVPAITADKASMAADKLVNYLHGNGYTDVTRDQTPAVHGTKDGLTVTMRSDGRQNLLFSVVTGCNVKP